MEDDDPVGYADIPPLDTGARGDSPDLGPEEDDEWDEESAFSDACTEVMVDEDEDDIVPPSFSLSTPVDPLSNGEAHNSGEQPSWPSSESKEEQPLPSIGVYGSDSKYPYMLFLRFSADSNGHRASLRSATLRLWICT